MKLILVAFALIPSLCFALPRDMVHPLGTANISSGFGERFHPVIAEMRHHDGIDLPAPIGTPVRSLAWGIIIDCSSRGGYGNIVTILHEDGWTTVYAHLATQRVMIGQRVDAGVFIGNVGQTGQVTGPHLHFELRLRGKRLNPLIYLPFLKSPAVG